jgi:acylphosphatase
MVQGVGFRFFTRDRAEDLGLGGYVRNLRDGRVEVYAVGTGEQLAALREAIGEGPRFSSVTEVIEESAHVEPRHAGQFIVTYGNND